MERKKGQRKPFHYKLYKTPKEAGAALGVAGLKKTLYPIDKLLILGFMAGVFIAFGALLAITVAGGIGPESYSGIVATTDPNNGTLVISRSNFIVSGGVIPPGLRKLLAGATFSIALFLVIVTGAELFTGNTMVLTMGVLNRKISWKGLVYSWVLSYVGNFIGCLGCVYFFGYLTEIFDHDPWKTYLQNFVRDKVEQDLWPLFLKGIAANWLVCLGVFMAAVAEDVSGKFFATTVPVAAFTAMGFEHSIANMAYVPLGLMYGADTTWGRFFWRSLLFSTLGNIIGGAFFVGAAMWYFYHAFQWEDRPVPSNLHQHFVFSCFVPVFETEEEMNRELQSRQ